MVESPRRGEIYWVDFRIPIGSEQGHKRPALVVQNDAGNQTAGTTIVVPITSRFREKEYRFHVMLPEGLLPKPGVVLCEQLRTVAKERLEPERLACCDARTMQAVDEALEVSLGLFQ